MLLATAEGGLKDCVNKLRDVSAMPESTTPPIGPTTLNPYAILPGGDCTLTIDCVRCLADPTHSNSEVYISCKLHYQYCQAGNVGGSMPLVINTITVIMYVLALLASASRPSELPDLLAPPKTLPQADPVLFQRLDHTFTRRQWLNSIHSCQSKLHAGFPSDHYLLVTEIGVRLQARTPKPP